MELLDLGNIPIPGDAPAGKDVRYEDSFEALIHEIGKLSSISDSATIDVNKVVSLGTAILKKESKHIQVAAYLGYGLMKTKKMEGLAQGVHILKELIENFWESLFPPLKRMKGRRSALVWWEKKVADFIAETDQVTWEKDKRDFLINDFDVLNQFLGENMEDAPLLNSLIQRIKSVVLEKEEPVPEPEIPESAGDSEEGESDQPDGAEQAPGEVLILSDMDDATMFSQGLNLIGRSIEGLRQQNSFDPVPYRFNRIVPWTPVEEPPMASAGKTTLPPPDDQIITQIVSLYDSSKWQELADFCEPKVQEYPFWLDLSRYVAESMEQLEHQDVSIVIEAEILLFVSRLEGLETLCFSDGTPFADVATQEWLKQIDDKKSDDQPGSDSGPADLLEQNISQQMKEAQALIKKDKFDAALSLLVEHHIKSVSAREKFLWKIAVCRLLINEDKIKIAASYVDDILENIETYKLEAWEPDNAVDALSLVLTGLRLQENSQHEQLIESVITKISMLDPVTALKMI
ncbi:MAG: type VI secretion system protein TssA [Desulfobacteraceae bacterium]|nr:type VI secretion system protein TssA [Desulfobacteraceae bacterium]